MKLLWGVLLAGLTTACVTTTVYKDLIVLDKNKSTAQIYMGAEYDYFVNPVIDYDQAMREVVQLCKNWGYKSATVLADYDLLCAKGTDQYCERYKVIYTYQCLTEQDLQRVEEND